MSNNGEELSKKVLLSWQTVWVIWERIGLSTIKCQEARIGAEMDNEKLRSSGEANSNVATHFTQDTLTAYITTFADLYKISSSLYGVTCYPGCVDICK